MKIAIIGGGIGGLTLANCLQNSKIQFTLYEKAKQLTDVGAGIGISESAYELLKELGLGNDIIEKSNFVQDAIIVNKAGKTIRKLPIKNGGFCIHRAELINILSKKLNSEKIKLNYEIENFVTAENNVKLKFKNGQTATYDYVFVSDGINSKFRNQLFPNIKKRYSGQTVWRGISNCELSHNFQNAYLEFWGENLRFATIPLNKKQYYWYACEYAIEGEVDNELTVKTELQKKFKNYNSELKQVIEKTDIIIRNDMCDLKPHNENWHENNVVFIGDSIHATTANLAQGGCQAIEDAFTITKLITAKGFSNEVFSDYKNIRKAKVNYIINQSWNYGKISHQKNKLMEVIIHNLFRILPNKIFENQYSKLIDLEYLKK